MRVPLRQTLERFDVPSERRRTPVRAARGRTAIPHNYKMYQTEMKTAVYAYKHALSVVL